MLDTECMSCLCLFPGPLQILCQDQEVRTVADLKVVLKDSGFGTRVLTYLLQWFATWKTRGIFIQCKLRAVDLVWARWEWSQVETFTHLVQLCLQHHARELLEWCYRCHPKQNLYYPILYDCIRKGNLPVFQWLHEKQFHCNAVQVFADCCYTNQLDLAQWIYHTYLNLPPKNLSDIYVECCRKGHIQMVKWLRTMFKDILVHMDRYGFRLSCYENQSNVVQWLLPQIALDFNFTGHLFFKSCARGNLSVAKVLFPYIDLDFWAKPSFYYACAEGTLSMVQWLWNIPPVQECLDDENMLLAFCQSYHRGQWEIAQWLHDNWKGKPLDYVRAMNYNCGACLNCFVSNVYHA